MLVTIEREALKNISISSVGKSVTIGQQTITLNIETNLGPRGIQGPPGSVANLTPAEADAVISASTLLDGEVNGLTPLAFYNIAKAT